MIKHIQLYGERHSGTNWLKEILRTNIQFEGTLHQLGWKHWFPDIRAIDKCNINDYLFIVITRNPYDWTKAMHEIPHHVDPNKYHKTDIMSFLESKWRCVVNYHHKRDKADQEMFLERNPETLQPFKNILEMRAVKNMYFINLDEIVPNFIHIKYESLLNDGVGVIDNMIKEFELRRKTNNMIVNAMKRPPKPLRPDVKKFIDDNTDWGVEEILGYKKRK